MRRVSLASPPEKKMIDVATVADGMVERMTDCSHRVIEVEWVVEFAERL